MKLEKLLKKNSKKLLILQAFGSEAKACVVEAKANGRGAENFLEGAGYVYRLAAFEARGRI